MNLYIDRQNLINIFREKNNPLKADAIRTMKRQLNIRFQFSKEEALNDDELSTYLLDFTEGIEAHVSHTYQPDGYTPYELKSNIHNTHSDKQGLFLLNAPESKVRICQRKGGLMIFGSGEEFNLFERLFLNRLDYDFHRGLKIGSSDLNQWSCLENFALPFTDIILIDNYICHCDDATLNANLLELLSTMHKGKEAAANIVLFTDKDRFTQEFASFRESIRAKVQAITGQNPNLTVVTWRQQRGINHYAEHDRTIFTNYLRLKSGDTFNYWDSTGAKITHGRELDLYSLAKRESFKLASDMLSDLNAYLDWCKNNNPYNIQGDKVSNFLIF